MSSDLPTTRSWSGRTSVSLAACLAFLAALVDVRPCRADEASQADLREETPPPSGKAFLAAAAAVAGASLGWTIGGAVECTILDHEATGSSRQGHDAARCYGVAFGISGSMLLSSLPMAIVGTSQRRAYNDWKRAHPNTEWEPPPRIKTIYEHSWWRAVPGGVVIGLRGAF